MRSRRRLDRFELGALVLLAALSMWDVASNLVIAHAHGLVWTRTDGFFAVDQLQYLAWIQSSAHHWLIGDVFVLRPTPADYLQPAILLSGLLHPGRGRLLARAHAVEAGCGACDRLGRRRAQPAVLRADLRPARGARARAVLRVAERRQSLARGDRGHDVDVAVLGIPVRPDRRGADHRRPDPIRGRPGFDAVQLDDDRPRSARRARGRVAPLAGRADVPDRGDRRALPGAQHARGGAPRRGQAPDPPDRGHARARRTAAALLLRPRPPRRGRGAPASSAPATRSRRPRR